MYRTIYPSPEKRKNPPSINQIYEFWYEKIPETSLGVDWVDGKERCWRCGYKRALQRCHILPKSLAGSNDVNNFVLLCKSCHEEAPNSKNPQKIWHWIKITNYGVYDLFWVDRRLQEFKNVYGVDFDSYLDQNKKLLKNVHKENSNFRKILKSKMSKKGIHFGKGLSAYDTCEVFYETVESLK